MIPVRPPDEPAEFDARCRQPGRAWLEANPSIDPHRNPLWTAFCGELRAGFAQRCGFLAMWIPRGTVDHWRSVKSSPALAYEWANYRFVDGAVNSAKKPAWEAELIDPFEVRDDWFEVLLPSLQMIASPRLEPGTRRRAEFTLRKLGLRDREDVLRLRREWLTLYERGELTIEGLRRMAPLNAAAVARREALAKAVAHGKSLAFVRR